jgi:hypothetical protein
MKPKRGVPMRVRSMEGLGVGVEGKPYACPAEARVVAFVFMMFSVHELRLDEQEVT